MIAPSLTARGGPAAALLLVVAMAALPSRAAAVDDPGEPDPPRLGPVARYLVPVGGMLGVNVSIWAFNRYVSDAAYARISPTTVAANFSNGFGWDEDGFVVNQFGHPYQGGLYHNAARAAGLGFWESLPYATLGSLQWELFMESDPPAVNDLVTTSFGGIIVGEVLLRSARLVLDDSTQGLERFARELGAAALDPAGALGRLFSGAAFRLGSAPEAWPFRLELSAGLDRVTFPDAALGRLRTFHFETRLTYGELPRPGDRLGPFDRFTASVGANVGVPAAATLLDMDGVLAGVPIACGESRCVLTLSQSFAYYHGPLFQVGTTGLGAGFQAELALGRGFELDLTSEILGVPLGGFDSPHAAAFGPQYNMGPGATVRTDLRLRWGRWRLSLDNRRYWIATVHGAKGHELAGISSLLLGIPLMKPVTLEIGSAFYDRLTLFEGQPREQRTVFVAITRLVWAFGGEPPPAAP